MVEAEAMADTDEELFLLQIQDADFQSQLDVIQARINAFTEQLDVKPVQLSAPTDEKAIAIWEAAGLQDGMLLEDGLQILEHWIWTQPNTSQLTREGWIHFVYTIFGESLDKLLEVAH
jgi:hypothetical protein